MHALLMAAVLASPPPSIPRTAWDARTLEGTWEVTGLKLNGVNFPDPPPSRLVFRGAGVTFIGLGGKDEAVGFSLREERGQRLLVLHQRIGDRVADMEMKLTVADALHLEWESGCCSRSYTVTLVARRSGK